MDIKIYEDKMEKSLANLEDEYTSIRAGRANPRILDKIQVDYYGTMSSLQSVANVSVPEARMIQIQPWESSLIKDIEKAIFGIGSWSDTGQRWQGDPSCVPGTDRRKTKRIGKRCKEKR